MPREIYQRTVVVAPNLYSGLVYDISIPPRIVSRIDIRVPPGPNGSLRFAILNSGQQIIPYTQGELIIADNEAMTWDLSDYVVTGSWQVYAVNYGRYAHSVYIRLHADPVQPESSPAATQPIPSELISSL